MSKRYEVRAPRLDDLRMLSQALYNAGRTGDSRGMNKFTVSDYHLDIHNKVITFTEYKVLVRLQNIRKNFPNIRVTQITKENI